MPQEQMDDAGRLAREELEMSLIRFGGRFSYAG